jgi:transposase
MTRRQVTHYPNEFKESSAKLAVKSKESVSQTAKNLGVHVATLHGWIKKYYPKTTSTSKPSSQNTSLEELKQLKKENARLREECDILKKAAAYFAKEIK